MKPSTKPLFRFAPTPSGYLHAGNAAAFVFTWLLAQKNNASILLRIDDIDAERKRPAYVEDIFRTLEWLGLEYQLGPSGPDDFEQNWSQSKRLERYHEMLRSVADTGLLFGCKLSRAEIIKCSTDGSYPQEGYARAVPLDTEDCSWRIKITDEKPTDETFVNGLYLPNASAGENVLRRRNGLPAYHIASLADDLHFGVTDIVRGQDLFLSTIFQLQLAKLLSAEAFMDARFYHHPLTLGTNGEKLSKSAGATAVSELRKNPKGKQIIFAQAAAWFQLKTMEYNTLEDLLITFLEKNAR